MRGTRPFAPGIAPELDALIAEACALCESASPSREMVERLRSRGREWDKAGRPLINGESPKGVHEARVECRGRADPSGEPNPAGKHLLIAVATPGATRQFVISEDCGQELADGVGHALVTGGA